jgi:glycosyltransferase involved in cell wall biosynthesis
MVIQEAMVHGRPLLVSDIGGMREKVKDGITGFHVAANSPLIWGGLLSKLASQATSTWDQIRQSTQQPITNSACAKAHVELIY